MRVDRRVGGLSRWILLACAMAVAAAAMATAESWPVVRPLLFALVVACVFYGSLASRSGAAVVEVGTIYVAVVMLYLGFPLLGYLSNDLAFTSTSDIRLFTSSPSPTEMGRIAWFYAVHLLCFAVTYGIVRGNVRFAPRISIPGSARPIVLLGLLLAILAFFWFLGRFYDLTAGDYLESYLVSARLPLLLAQVANHLGGMRLTLEVALLVVFCADFRRYRGLVLCLLLLIGVTTFVKLGGRTEFVLAFGGVVVAYHWLVKPLSIRLLTVAGSVLVLLFLVAGGLRDNAFGKDQEVRWNPLSHASEFETIFANAYDLDQRREDGGLGRIPLSLLMSDVFALVPQQLSPVQKISPSQWYVTEFYPETAAGGGAFAFGTVSEAILGGGMPGLIVRGTLLGAALALFHRWAAGRRRQFWPVVIYLWAALNVYQCFRVTTFYPAVLFFYRVVPVIVGVTILERLAMRPRRTRPPAPDPPGFRMSRPVL